MSLKNIDVFLFLSSTECHLFLPRLLFPPFSVYGTQTHARELCFLAGRTG